MFYKVFIPSVTSVRQFLPYTEDFYSKNIIQRNVEAYESIYLYEDRHVAYYNTTFNDKGNKTLAGITDVKTDKVVFDFDHKENPDLALDDARMLVARLLEIFGENKTVIRCYFSGNKGYHVEVHFKDEYIDRAQFESIIYAHAGDLKTFDESVKDQQRVFRFPFSRHSKSKLYKIPVSLDNFTNVQHTHSDFMDSAKQIDDLAISALASFSTTPIPPQFKNIKLTKEQKPQIVTEVTDFPDMANRPTHLTPAKYVLSMGYFEEAESNLACMRVAAALRYCNFTKDQTWAMIKIATNRRNARLKLEKISDAEEKNLWREVIEYVYGSTWAGATYSDSNDAFLQKTIEKYNLERYYGSISSEILDIADVGNIFLKFVNEIDNNTIKTGIAELDENVMLTSSMMVGVLGAPSSGKCLGINTPVRMYNGEVKLVQDIIVGDLLMGDDSTPRTVLSLARGQEEMFKIRQLYGDDYVVNKSHILSLRCDAEFSDPKKAKAYIPDLVIDISVQDYLDKSNTWKKYYKGFKVGVAYPSKSIDLDPYILGAWLGDGTSLKSEITNPEPEIISYFDDRMGQYGLTRTTRDVIGHYYANKKRDGNEFLNMLRNLNVYGNKHIPKLYLYNNRIIRLSVLAGLLDTDGYLYNNNKYEICAKNNQLANDIVELTRSLGFKASINKKLAKYNSFTKGKRYIGVSEVNIIYISGENLGEIPCKVPRKKCQKSEMATNPLSSSISLSSLGEGDYYGFTLDGNHRFLLGDFTVTHNTGFAVNTLEYQSTHNIHSFFMSSDMAPPLFYASAMRRICKLPFKQLVDLCQKLLKQSVPREDWTPSVKNAWEKVQENFKNVGLCFRSGPSIEDIKNNIDAYEQRKGVAVKFFVMDYLEKMQSKYSDPTASTGHNAARLADLTRDKSLNTFLLLQTQKAAGDPSSPLTTMRNIKGASVIEQDCRVVLTTWREGFNPDVKGRNLDDKFQSFACVKNNMGNTGRFDFYIDPDSGLFRTINEEELNDFERVKHDNINRKMAKANGGNLPQRRNMPISSNSTPTKFLPKDRKEIY